MNLSCYLRPVVDGKTGENGGTLPRGISCCSAEPKQKTIPAMVAHACVYLGYLIIYVTGCSAQS